MKLEKLFRILSAVLMPVVFILAFIAVPFLLFSISNPAMLFGVFVFACVVLYMVKSVQFYRRHIEPGIPAKANTRDWIRVNAFVSVFFVLQILLNAFLLFNNREEMMATMQEFLNRMQEAQGTTAMHMSVDEVYNTLKNLMIIFVIFDVLLAAHIVCSFKLLKKYRYLLVSQE